MADYSEEIARIEAILNAGTRSISTDGLSATYTADLRKRLAELRRLDTLSKLQGRVRPPASTQRLGYF